MATDVDVQFFSHLNGLTLDNNWGDLIRLLDTCLVNGKPLPATTSAEINDQGDVILNLSADHQCLLLQVVELSGFDPVSLNQKYRIKGILNNTQLILKPQNPIVEKNVITKGNAKLAALGYEIVFRDNNDIKRVYRAQNPTAQHPYIRVDESLSDGVNSYDANYAKYAMVGLLEHMDHIDDYQNPDVLQLPFDPSDPAKNWRIAGTGASVVRGWSKWYWATGSEAYSDIYESQGSTTNNRNFTLIGDIDSFYFVRNLANAFEYKLMSGCGLFKPNYDTTLEKNYFLMTSLNNQRASTYNGLGVINGGIPLAGLDNMQSGFFIPQQIGEMHIVGQPILYDFATGYSNIASSMDVAALEIPIIAAKKFRGNLKHVYYSGKSTGVSNTTPILSEYSMYVCESLLVRANGGQKGGVYFYLGELK